MAVITGGHRAGTPLERHIAPARLPGARASLGGGLVLAVAYVWIGYRFTVDGHVIVFDAVDRLTRAFMAWHNDPAKLAAIGFVFPPAATLALLPVALVKPLATSLVAIPLSSAVFAAGTVVTLDRICARCEMSAMQRLPLVALFAFNPFWLFYAGNGMSEAVASFFLALGLYGLISWYATTEPRHLIAAGFGLAVLALVRYGFLFWAVLLALLIGVALVRRRVGSGEIEGSVLAFAAPVVYATALWILLNWLVVGEPFGWISDTATTAPAINAAGPDSFDAPGIGDVAERLGQLAAQVFPLALAVVPALVAVFVAQRNDMALWLAAVIALGIVVMGVHAYAAEKESLLAMRDAMPMYVAAFAGAAWLFHSLPGARTVVAGATGVLLVVNLFTAWHGMRSYPVQGLEQAFTRTLFSGDDQEGSGSIGGYVVGIAPEARTAEELKHLPDRPNSILADNAQTFAPILLYGRPQNVVDRIDHGDAAFRRVLDDPYGKVGYLLVATGQGSPDLIARRYRGVGEGRVPGLTPIFRTSRYVLVRVDRRTR
jgi:hypothetical protein